MKNHITTEQARAIVGNVAVWELRAITRALSMLPILNTPEENRRLKAARHLLRRMKK